MNSYEKWSIAIVVVVMTCLIIVLLIASLNMETPNSKACQNVDTCDAQVAALHAYGRQLLNALFVLNGGAAVALLTLAGNVLNKENPDASLIVRAVQVPLLCFGLGVVAAILLNFLWYLGMHATTFKEQKFLHFEQVQIAGFASAVLFVAGVVLGAVSFRQALERTKEVETNSNDVEQ